ncbi:MAG: OmpA family protein, partial [Gemmobacter sp.]|nr:OmpA family protein [Gemmobacter sp.]
SAAALTEAQILENLTKQKTRGLTIAPTGTAPAPAQAATTVTTDTGAKVEYAAVPSDEQVNINISFDFDSAALRADQKPQLAALCNVMKTADIARYRIVGHTDSSGSAAYNERLSLLRAEEVKRYLSSDCGITADRMEAVGVGSQFLSDPANPRGDVNRRVEFQALG